jgi:hypothetical protein
MPTINVYFPLSPFDERHQLEEGDCVDERDVRRLYVFHRRAAKAIPKLLADGWVVWYSGYGFEADSRELKTQEEAETRLAILGIPLAWVEVSLRHYELDVDDFPADER